LPLTASPAAKTDPLRATSAAAQTPTLNNKFLNLIPSLRLSLHSSSDPVGMMATKLLLALYKSQTLTEHVNRACYRGKNGSGKRLDGDTAGSILMDTATEYHHRHLVVFLRLLRHRYHVVAEIGDDPDRAHDDEKDDQHAKGKGQNIVGTVGAAAQM
jgi:hypothetical protein